MIREEREREKVEEDLQQIDLIFRRLKLGTNGGGIQERVFCDLPPMFAILQRFLSSQPGLRAGQKKGVHGGISSSIPAQGKNNCTRVKGEWECVSSHSKKELAARMAAGGGDMAFMTRAVYLPARAR